MNKTLLATTIIITGAVSIMATNTIKEYQYRWTKYVKPAHVQQAYHLKLDCERFSECNKTDGQPTAKVETKKQPVKK